MQRVVELHLHTTLATWYAVFDAAPVGLSWGDLVLLVLENQLVGCICRVVIKECTTVLYW